jgi:hypothetical protein
MRVLAAAWILSLTAPGAFAEATKTLTAEIGGSEPFAIENLAGTMRVVAGSGSGVTATATVHGESEEVVGLVTFEKVVGKGGVPTLRVRYPVNKYTRYRYPGHGHDGGKPSSPLLSWISGWFSSDADYDGVRVDVSAEKGLLLYADVEVKVPGKIDAAFRNRVGPISGKDLSGKTLFDTGDGNVTLEKISGDTKADTGSGDVDASGLAGSFTCDTGSGECLVRDFQGESLVLDTGSGAVRASGARANRIKASTGSGRVELRNVDAEDIKGDTGSGSLEVEASGARLKRLSADTGSGDVTVRLPSDAGFRARADIASGQVRCSFSDAKKIVHDDEVVGYDRGDLRIEIKVDTGSGSLFLEPRP